MAGATGLADSEAGGRWRRGARAIEAAARSASSRARSIATAQVPRARGIAAARGEGRRASRRRSGRAARADSRPARRRRRGRAAATADGVAAHLARDHSGRADAVMPLRRACRTSASRRSVSALEHRLAGRRQPVVAPPLVVVRRRRRGGRILRPARAPPAGRARCTACRCRGGAIRRCGPRRRG